MAKKYVPFYQVESSVGKFAANKTNDVMLVQFFIAELAKHPDFASPLQPAAPLAATGVCDGNTQAWIDWYQSFVKSKGSPITTDGRVDPAANLQPDWPNTKGFMYTIMHLNFSFRKRFKARHSALEDDLFTPPALREIFKKADF